MSTVACSALRSRDVWLLASATVYEAREVATELNERVTSVDLLIESIKSLAFVVCSMRPGLKRIATKQARLITRLETSHIEEWAEKDCADFAELLQELVLDERNFISRDLAHFRVGGMILARHTRLLLDQLPQLEDILQRLEALAVPEWSMPGDADCKEFLSLLAGPEEYDFSDNSERRQAPLYA